MIMNLNKIRNDCGWGAVVLTYDTTLQVISRSSQRDLLGRLFLLGSHFFALLFSSVSATEKSRDGSDLSSC